MKISNIKYLSCTLILFVAASAGFAQTTSTRSNNETLTRDAILAQEAVNEVLLKSGTSFREGLLAYEDKKLSDAAGKFNKAVEVFLFSTLNIQREPRLQNCYNQLVETIYRIEFPTDNQLPQVRNLSATCGWNIDGAFADKITTIARNSLSRPVAPPTTAVAGSTMGPIVPSEVHAGRHDRDRSAEYPGSLRLRRYDQGRAFERQRPDGRLSFRGSGRISRRKDRRRCSDGS